MNKVWLALSLLVSCACSSIPTNLEQPKVQLQQVDVANSNFTDANLVFNFLVENPNPVPVSVDQVDYALKINGKPFTKGVLDKGLKVGANSSVLVPLPIAIKYSDLVTSVTDLLQQGSSKYQLKGAVKVGFFSIPFDQDGTVNLSDLAK